MGFFGRLFGRGETKALGDAEMQLLRDIYGGRETESGPQVSWRTALEVTTAIACTQVIADGIATVPCKVLQKDPASGSRTEALDHPLTELLGVAPNDWQTSLEFRETLAFHVVLCGNAFAFINRVRGRVAELVPIEPGRVLVEQKTDLSLVYRVTGTNGAQQVFPADAIWHVRGPSWNSWMGLEPIRQAREALGLALAGQQAQAKFHRNGVRPPGLYTVEGTLTRQQYSDLREWLDRNFSGAENAGKPMILDRNAKWTPLQITAADAQIIESRRYQVEEVCRAFRVMPIMVGYSDKSSTYASAEQMFLAHVVHTLRPWHRRFEASMYRALLTPEERRVGIYMKFLDAELLRGAAKDRGEYYARGIQSGWLLRNEAREWEDLDPVEGLSEPLAPVNMAVGNPPAPDQGNADVPG